MLATKSVVLLMRKDRQKHTYVSHVPNRGRWPAKALYTAWIPSGKVQGQRSLPEIKGGHIAQNVLSKAMNHDDDNDDDLFRTINVYTIATGYKASSGLS
jgi:hypothetical protein